MASGSALDAANITVVLPDGRKLSSQPSNSYQAAIDEFKALRAKLAKGEADAPPLEREKAQSEMAIAGLMAGREEALGIKPSTEALQLFGGLRFPGSARQTGPQRLDPVSQMLEQALSGIREGETAEARAARIQSQVESILSVMNDAVKASEKRLKEPAPGNLPALSLGTPETSKESMEFTHRYLVESRDRIAAAFNVIESLSQNPKERCLLEPMIRNLTLRSVDDWYAMTPEHAKQQAIAGAGTLLELASGFVDPGGALSLSGSYLRQRGNGARDFELEPMTAASVAVGVVPGLKAAASGGRQLLRFLDEMVDAFKLGAGTAREVKTLQKVGTDVLDTTAVAYAALRSQNPRFALRSLEKLGPDLLKPENYHAHFVYALAASADGEKAAVLRAASALMRNPAAKELRADVTAIVALVDPTNPALRSIDPKTYEHLLPVYDRFIPVELKLQGAVQNSFYVRGGRPVNGQAADALKKGPELPTAEDIAELNARRETLRRSGGN